MKKTISIIFVLLAFQLAINAQEVKGNFSALPNQPIYLFGFQDFEAYVIDSSRTDATGDFSLAFSKTDYGMGYLESVDNKPYILLLTNEEVGLKGEAPSYTGTIAIYKGSQNRALIKYASQQPKREKTLTAWRFLQEMYNQDSLFSSEKTPKQAISKEIQRIKTQDESFISNLPKNSYVKWFLPIRKLVSNIPFIVQYRPEEIPATRDALREINYADERLYKSGLLKEAIENHIWFIENSSGPLEAVFRDLNVSIEIIIKQLKEDTDKFNLVTSKLFEVLEERGLFTSAEYLSNRLLEGDDCGCLNPEFEKKLEKYGKMAEGETAPDINFGEFTYYPDGLTASKLSEVAADYKLVIFAAGWCPHCNEELPLIADYYPQLKEKNIEVILVSLDETSKDFAQFAGSLPFLSTTDYGKWEGKAVTDYQIYATPTYFLLDKNLKILKRLRSVEHLKSWVEYSIE